MHRRPGLRPDRAIGEAALLLGAFREAAHHNAALPDLAASLEQSVTGYLADFEPTEEREERFATALPLEIPDDDPVARLTSCGHLAPLLLRNGHPATVPELVPSPPLGVGLTAPDDATVTVLPFTVGDTLLLYTDGVVEARNRRGTFFPLTERVAEWAGQSPQSLLRHVQRDLLAHTGGRLGDDAALIAIRRAPAADHPSARPDCPRTPSETHPPSQAATIPVDLDGDRIEMPRRATRFTLMEARHGLSAQPRPGGIVDPRESP